MTTSPPDLDDDALVTAFEALAIHPTDFRHREHVRLGFALVQRDDFGVAALRFRAALRAFADAIGARGKYHETLTWAHLAIIAERRAARPCATSLEFLAANPDLLDHRATLGRYYDVAAITSSAHARAVFVLPERA